MAANCSFHHSHKRAPTCRVGLTRPPSAAAPARTAYIQRGGAAWRFKDPNQRKSSYCLRRSLRLRFAIQRSAAIRIRNTTLDAIACRGDRPNRTGKISVTLWT